MPKSNVLSRQTVEGLVSKYNINITITETGDHWFHVEEEIVLE
ncbi:hypothetical protein [Clostridium sp.]|nr:hypothetical protein [Clostridium sp.]